jgi:hypothetical protein
VSIDQEHEWQKSYEAALLELDPVKLSERIERAYQEIQRYMELAADNSNGAERQAVADALANLRVLRREVGLAINDSNHKEPESPVKPSYRKSPSDAT